jgi:Zn-dependent protease
MFSLEPQRTDYDLNFRCFGFPIRVHPLFWIVGLILGANMAWDDKGNVNPESGVILLSWISVIFISILVHELGHAFAMRFFGQSSHIVLYMLGGLAVPDSSYGSFSSPARLAPRDQIIISLAGPFSGFLLALLTVMVIFALGGEFYLDFDNFPLFYRYSLPQDTSASLGYVIYISLFANIFWGLVNLLPVFPLDGGQVSRELFQMNDHWHGLTRCLWLSIGTAAVVALIGWVMLESIFIGLMFASLAASNYMMLQQITGGGPGGGRW